MIRTSSLATLLAASLLLSFALNAAHADGALNRGDAVVTGFSGVTVGDPSTDDPVDGTFIDVDGPAMKVLPLEASAPPAGQLLSNPSRLDVKARDVGQVFGIALDDGLMPDPIAALPNIYLGATSAYGLQIVIPDANDGRPERITKGHPNAAWMTGQFGPGGGPGSIWKVDGTSRAASLFATLPANSGPGIGNIAYDAASQHLFASDLDTGLIHRIDMAGKLVDTFDHGVAGRTQGGLSSVADDGTKADITSTKFNSLDAKTWGFTQPERRVTGLAVDGGRLYYAVASGPEVWSVSLSLSGAFGSDARRELEVSGTPGNHAISDIAFDGKGLMYVAQRGDARGSYDYKAFIDSKASVVFRYRREIPDDPETPGTWVPVPDEVPVGLPADHRNTAGGIALGYGYGEDGRMRPGACGGMLWSTGSNLRTADGSGAAIHGLQGSDRALVRPDNEPPSAAYFVATDSQSTSSDDLGHVGDVAIWQPCAQLADAGADVYASMPELPPGYYPPGDTPPGMPPVGWPASDFNLRLDKDALPAACVPGGLGFLCTYIVRVTNTGPDPYIGPVTVEDDLPAAPAGATMSFDNQPPWTCLPFGPTHHHCTYDPAVLWPGTSIDLKVTVDTPAPAPVCSLTNTARITWPWGLGDTNPGDDFDLAIAGIPAAHCPPVAGELANLKIEKFWWGGSEPVCKDKPGHFSCEFMVGVVNTGPGTYNGPFEIEEQIPAGTTVASLSPGFSCTNGAPATCTHDPVVFGANQGTLLGVAVKVPKDMADDLACKLTNTVKILKALGGTDQNTDATDDESQHSAIIPGTLAQCPGLVLSNLKIQTTDATGGKCPVKDGKWECLFKVRVWNFGKAYANTLEFMDHVGMPFHAGKTLTIAAPPKWQCNAVLPHQQICKSDDPGLGAGDSVEFMATVKVPLTPAGPCWVKNQAIIWKAPGETAQNSFAGDDKSTAQAQFEPVFPLNGQPYCVSPMQAGPEDDLKNPEAAEANLSITKTAGASAATAAGQSTPFVITVTNTGPGVFNGPIVVRETLPAEPQNASWPAPWVCEGQTMAGQPNDALCSHPVVALEPNESVTLNLDVEMPNSYIAPSGSDVNCGYTNHVAIEVAAGGTPQNTNPADDTATAEVLFASFEKHGQTFCGIDDVTTPPPSPPPPTCPQGWSTTPVAGKCCPPRSWWDGEQCSKDEPPAGDDDCPADFTGTPPNCRRIIIIDPPKCVVKSCGRDATWDGKKCACVAKRCPEGTTGDYPKCKPVGCPKGMIGKPPNCRKPPTTCGAGFKGTPPNCTKIVVDPPKCPKGFSGRPPNCKKVPPPACPKGFRGTPPNCKRVVVDPPKACPKGMVGKPPNCRKPPPRVCPPGFTGKPPACKPVQKPKVKPLGLKAPAAPARVRVQ
ncbi:MAG: hypothetical protein AB7J30_06760 [Hyphomicrobium sp.]|uniref:hypothetical protein n=1 Tax=Hyphomicrobium sp. TaxID=82 RepID=UPI003D12D1A8